MAQLGAETDLVAKKAMEAQQRKARINMQRSIFKGMEDSKDKGVRTNIHIFGRIVKGLKAIGLFFLAFESFQNAKTGSTFCGKVCKDICLGGWWIQPGSYEPTSNDSNCRCFRLLAKRSVKNVGRSQNGSSKRWGDSHDI